MKSLGMLVLLLAIVAIVAIASCCMTSCLLMKGGAPPAKDFHHWLHSQLGITPTQDKALEEEESRFAIKRKALVQEIQSDNAELAVAMSQDREFSPRVQNAVEKIHHAQSALEKATLEHIFAMKPILTPDQFDQLLKQTDAALNSPSDL